MMFIFKKEVSVVCVVDGVKKACDLFKSQREFARNVGVSQTVVNKWLNDVCKPKAENAINIETATDGRVTRKEIRPDIKW
jgi:DNA-binding transcriptional regulator YdaS (Cro superfamily)